MASHAVLLKDWRDMRLEPRSVWLLRQYGRRGDRQRNRWRHETQGEPNYRRKRTGVHCTGSIIRWECITVLGLSGWQVLACAGNLISIGRRIRVQRIAASRVPLSLWAPHFAGFSQHAVHTPSTGDRGPAWQSGLGQDCALQDSLTNNGYRRGEWQAATSAWHLVRALCGDTPARAAPIGESNLGHAAIHWMRAYPHRA